MDARDRAAFRGRMDRLQVEQLARRAGLPRRIAAHIAELVTATGLPDHRRAEVFDELVGHFEDGLAAGRTPEQLLERFGGSAQTAQEIAAAKQVVTPEALGGTRRDGWLTRLGRDVRYALRRLTARPAFTVTAVLSLAVGIGANGAVFTLVNDIIFRRPLFEHPERLVDIYRSDRSFSYNVLSEPDVVDFRQGLTSMAGLATTKLTFATHESAGQTFKLIAELVSADYFQTLGLHPARGRLIAPSDAPARGQSAVVVLSDRSWREVFGADPSIVGKAINLNGTRYDVIGMLPASYSGRFRGLPTDVYIPVMMIDRLERASVSPLLDRRTSGTFVTVRLKPDVTIPQAQLDFDHVAEALKARHIEGWNNDVTMNVVRKSDVIIYPPVDRILLPVAGMLMLVVGLVLTVACANLAGFLLARAVDRRKEIAVRLALGATRGQLIMQLLVETVVLALGGGALGVLLGRLALRTVLSSNVPFPVPIDLALTVDWRVVAFSIAVSVLAGVLFGLMPALQATRMELASVIRDETTGGGRRRGIVRQLLLGGQVAVSMVLLVVAGLFMRSLDVARQVDAGFGSMPAAYAWVGVPAAATSAEAHAMLDRMVERLRAMPGVEAVGLAANLHLNTLTTQAQDVEVAGVAPPPGRTSHSVDYTAVDTGFAAAASLTLVDGRGLRWIDADSVVHAVLVNEAFAKTFFPGREAVGQQFRMNQAMVDIVGVVKTAKIRSLGEAPRPFIYAPWRTNSDRSDLWVVVRTATEEPDLSARMRAVIAKVDPGLFVVQSGTVASFIGSQTYPLRLGALSLMAFALVAALMACIGLYGAVSYAVAQRSREVGIRLSLGAAPPTVVRLLLWGGMRVVLGGAVAGLVGAVVAGKLLESLLFGIHGLDLATLTLAPLLLLVVAGVAAFLPARRVARISPIAALKFE